MTNFILAVTLLLTALSYVWWINVRSAILCNALGVITKAVIKRATAIGAERDPDVVRYVTHLKSLSDSSGMLSVITLGFATSLAAKNRTTAPSRQVAKRQDVEQLLKVSESIVARTITNYVCFSSPWLLVVFPIVFVLFCHKAARMMIMGWSLLWAQSPSPVEMPVRRIAL